jgi:hypothetical protein
LIDLISRCTAKNPAGRPPGFSVVCTEIEAIRSATATFQTVAPAASTQRSPAASGVFSKLPRSQNWVIAYTAIAVAVLLLVLFLVGRLVFQVI